MEKIIDINYDWQHKKTFEEEDLDILSGKIQVVSFPHVEQPVLDIDKYKNGKLISYYEKRIEIMKVEEDEENVFLAFEGIRGEARLYINGILAGKRHSEYGPFEVNITKFVKYNGFNKISLVLEHEAGGAVYGLAQLKRKASAYIDNAMITTKNILDVDKEVEVSVVISGLIEGMNVQAAIMDAKGNVVANAVTNPLRSLEINLNMKVADAEVWDIEDPVLYKLHIFLQYEAHILDEMEIPFGFRQTAFKADGFYLNGRKVKLCGVTRGSGLEASNYKPFPVLEETDAISIKRDLGMNIVKIEKESLSLSFIRKCDEIGLLTYIELPDWQESKEVLDEESTHLREMTSFIKAYRNYTSLILWGLGTIEKEDSFKRNLSSLLKKIDKKAIGGQAEDKHLIDVYTHRAYPHLEWETGLTEPDKIVQNQEIPYLVLNHWDFHAKSFDNETYRNEHALQHMRILDEVYGNSRMAGMINESFVDNSELTYIGGRKKVNYTGLLDTERQIKLAGLAYGSQQAYMPILEVSRNLQGSETAHGLAGELYVYTNCDKVKLYRNEVFVGEFYPDKETFPSLSHPPIIIDDYLGNVLSEVEGFSQKEATYIKTILMSMTNQNGKISLATKSRLVFGKFLSRINQNVIHALYQKYILGVGSPNVCYQFEGYKDDEKVMTVTKGEYTPVHIMADTARHQLVVGKTHDVTPIIIKVIDAYGNIIPYVNDVVRIETTGAVEIIGYTYQVLVGGRLTVYVKTTGDVGTGVVSIKSNELGEGQLIFQVQKHEVE